MNLIYPSAELWIQEDPTAHVAKCARVCYASEKEQNSSLDKKLVNTSTCKIRSYNPKEPIYIKDANGKIFELSHHPDRACEWNNKITYLKYTYAYIPFLKLSGLSDNKIEELRNFYNNSSQQTFTTPHLHVKHTIEDKFLQI